MKKICIQYMRDIKSLFPVIGIQEKLYLKNLKLTVNDYCEEDCISSMKELYQKFGTPDEIISNYYSTIDTQYIIKQISKYKFLKKYLFVPIIFTTIISTTYYMILRDRKII